MILEYSLSKDAITKEFISFKTGKALRIDVLFECARIALFDVVNKEGIQLFANS